MVKVIATIFILSITGAFLMFGQSSSDKLLGDTTEAFDTLSGQLDVLAESKLDSVNNQPAVKGSEVISAVKNAEAEGLTVYVQTTAGGGNVVTYGPVSRTPANSKLALTDDSSMIPYERNYVINVGSLFGLDGDDVVTYSDAQDKDTHIDLSEENPKLSFYWTNADGYTDAVSNNLTYDITGVLYSNAVVMPNVGVNKNFSYATNINHKDYINPKSTFRSVLIVNPQGVISGKYFEEMTVKSTDDLNVLENAMEATGIIQ